MSLTCNFLEDGNSLELDRVDWIWPSRLRPDDSWNRYSPVHESTAIHSTVASWSPKWAQSARHRHSTQRTWKMDGWSPGGRVTSTSTFTHNLWRASCFRDQPKMQNRRYKGETKTSSSNKLSQQFCHQCQVLRFAEKREWATWEVKLRDETHSGYRKLPTVGNHDSLPRTVSSVCILWLDQLNNVHAFNNLPEHNVPLIQPRSLQFKPGG